MMLLTSADNRQHTVLVSGKRLTLSDDEQRPRLASTYPIALTSFTALNPPGILCIIISPFNRHFPPIPPQS